MWLSACFQNATSLKWMAWRVCPRPPDGVLAVPNSHTDPLVHSCLCSALRRFSRMGHGACVSNRCTIWLKFLAASSSWASE